MADPLTILTIKFTAQWAYLLVTKIGLKSNSLYSVATVINYAMSACCSFVEFTVCDAIALGKQYHIFICLLFSCFQCELIVFAYSGNIIDLCIHCIYVKPNRVVVN